MSLPEGEVLGVLSPGVPDQLVAVPGGVAAKLAKMVLVRRVVDPEVFGQMGPLLELLTALWALLGTLWATGRHWALIRYGIRFPDRKNSGHFSHE